VSLAALFPLILAVHVALAVALFLPSLLLPFALRSRRPGVAPTGRVARALLWLQSTGTAIVGGGLALTGVLMLLVLGPQVVGQPWLLLALVVYALNLGLALFVQRPGLRRLLGGAASATEAVDPDVWRARARRQRYLSYVMAGAVGLIGFLMSTKPQL
jgi:hypothetical protein